MRQLFSAALAIMIVCTSASADTLTVQQSNIPAFPIGRDVTPNDRIELSRADEVTFLRRTASEAVQTICIGPYAGPISACPSCVPNRWGRCISSSGGVPGGSRIYTD